jgi:glycosyltransferase involved in cell wall biosynthesis
VSIVAAAAQLGAACTLDIIGDGEQRKELEMQVETLGIAGKIRFLGAQQYGSALLQRLSSYDAMLFTPTIEDTPRMIFDGYAAGLPLVASGIEYVKERAREEQAAVLLPRDDIPAAARLLHDLCRHRERLADLSWRARTAAEFHSAEAWYQRRAEWTFEAYDRHLKEQANL